MTRRRHRSGAAYETRVGYSRAVRDGDLVFVSGTAPIEPDGGCAPTIEEQAARCFAIVGEALAALDASPADVVRTRIFLVTRADFDAAADAHREFCGDAAPACTAVVVSALLDPRWRLEVEVDAVVREV